MGTAGSKKASNSKKSGRRAKEDIIIEKLRKGNKQALTLPESELREWARSLCYVDELKECYLNPEFAHTMTLFNDLDKKQQQINAAQEKERSGFLTSASAGGVSAPEQYRPDDLEDLDVLLQDLEQEQDQPHFKALQKNKNRVKIKLVIAEICKSSAQKTLRKMLSPVLTKFDHQQQFGMFHSAIVIGPWYIEWNNSSLCIPRKCYSGAAMLAADLCVGDAKKLDMLESIDKVAQVIIDWNVNKTYDQSTNNCQTFVDDICKALGIDTINFGGALGEYMRKLRESGMCELEFPISAEMRERIGLKESKVRFSSHRELDDFVSKCISKEAVFEERFKEEWGLLKSFDRAFWLRHWKDKNNPQYMPNEECPFQDPEVTMSFKKEWF